MTTTGAAHAALAPVQRRTGGSQVTPTDTRAPLRRLSLVGRFTVVSLVLTMLVGFVVARVASTQLRTTALREEADRVAAAVSGPLSSALRPQDLLAPLTAARFAQIDRDLRGRALSADTVAINVWRRDRTVAYSTDPRSVGRSGGQDHELDLALAGRLASEIKSAADVDITVTTAHLGSVMEIYVPLRLGSDRVVGAFELYRNLSGVDRRIAAVDHAMVLALGGGLALLLLVLLLLVRNASSQLRRQSVELAQFEARQEATRLQTEFVGVVSHELRTPLTAMLGFSELLLDEDVSATDRRQWTGLLHSGAQRLRHLVEQLMDLSRLDEGRLELVLRPASVPDAVAEALESFMTLPPGLRLEQRFEPDLPPVLADVHRLVEMVINLVSNAVKYSPDGGRILLEGRRAGNMVQLHVSDEGLGLPPEEMATIFERFHRVDDERRRSIEGTGLGLHITRRLAEMQGGSISVSSPGPGRGTTFTLALPVGERRSHARV